MQAPAKDNSNEPRRTVHVHMGEAGQIAKHPTLCLTSVTVIEDGEIVQFSAEYICPKTFIILPA